MTEMRTSQNSSMPKEKTLTKSSSLQTHTLDYPSEINSVASDLLLLIAWQNSSRRYKQKTYCLSRLMSPPGDFLLLGRVCHPENG